MKAFIIALVMVVVFLLFGCESSYRYECQDPDNWGEPQCQKPTCTASATCPEDLAGEPIEDTKTEVIKEDIKCAE